MIVLANHVLVPYRYYIKTINQIVVPHDPFLKITIISETRLFVYGVPVAVLDDPRPEKIVTKHKKRGTHTQHTRHHNNAVQP